MNSASAPTHARTAGRSSGSMYPITPTTACAACTIHSKSSTPTTCPKRRVCPFTPQIPFFSPRSASRPSLPMQRMPTVARCLVTRKGYRGRVKVLSVLGLLTLAGCGSSGLTGAQVAKKVGVDSCEKTTWVIANRVDGSKDTLYDCYLGGKDLCVTIDHGTAQNVTAEARILIGQTLSTDPKPTCVT